ncbi:helix-turn-helix domain-containing protein [Streptomyces sp. NPDC000349]|uniref:TetR/AcrR family transcriptional regulator n=1 Tax=Streptomyces sp. NPDC000349 TaxID=3154249 RepID=UPI00336AAB8F
MTSTRLPSVWERSRQMACEEIKAAALRLFITQGFEQTTVTQIAEEAGVSQRTLFRYFGTKEELICGDQDELGELLVRLAAEQPDDVSVWQVLRDGFVKVMTADHAPEQTLRISALILRTPALHASYTQKRQAWAISLMPVIRERLLAQGGEASRVDHNARTAIAVALACADAAVSTWVATRGEADLVTLYDQSFDLVRSAPCHDVRDRESAGAPTAGREPGGESRPPEATTHATER